MLLVDSRDRITTKLVYLSPISPSAFDLLVIRMLWYSKFMIMISFIHTCYSLGFKFDEVDQSP